MLNSDVFSLLGLAARARKICSGDVLLKDIRSKSVSLVIIAENASDNSKNGVINELIIRLIIV